MSIFDELTKKVTEVATSVAKKSEGLVEETKINFSIKSEEDKIKKLYAMIGEKVYQRHKNNQEIDQEITEMFKSVAACENEIALLRNKMNDLKESEAISVASPAAVLIQNTPKKLSCVHCAHPMDAQETFCSNCGNKSVEIAEKKPSQLFCSSCGKEIETGHSFCSACGQKVS